MLTSRRAAAFLFCAQHRSRRSQTFAKRHVDYRARAFTVEGETRAGCENIAIDTLITKNSGGIATEAKLIAARALGIPVILISPPAETGMCPAGHHRRRGNGVDRARS